MVFELITGDFLFDPKEDKRNHSRDEDHLALMLELMGPKTPRYLYTTGKYSRELFKRDGSLRHINNLEYWSLPNVLLEKYKLAADEVWLLSSFLEPMLALDPRKRCSAATALRHPWLNVGLPPVYDGDPIQTIIVSSSSSSSSSSPSSSTSTTSSSSSTTTSSTDSTIDAQKEKEKDISVNNST